MRLFLSPTSPFARIVKGALIEKNLLGATTEVGVDPWASPAELLAVNPLCQVPTLVLDDGQVLTNSGTIINWLERAYPVPSLLPAAPRDCARVLAVAALAHGVIESVVYVVIERRKPAGQQNEDMLRRRLQGIERVLGALAEQFAYGREQFHLDGLNMACMLDYVDLRRPELDWRMRYPRLAQWQQWAAARPSLKQSAPPPQ
jgi:glutathione S-transferase